MRVKIELKILRIILVALLLSFLITLGIKYVFDLRDVYNRMDSVIEEDRRKCLEIFTGFLDTAVNSFEKKFIRFSSDLASGRYNSPEEDSRKSIVLSGMFSVSYEKTFFLNCPNWKENICDDSTFPFMHNVKQWMRGDGIYDTEPNEVFSKLFCLEDAFFLVFVSTYVKDDKKINFVGIFDIAEFINKNLSDNRFNNLAVGKDGTVLYPGAIQSGEKGLNYVVDGKIDEFVQENLKKSLSGYAEFFPADKRYDENYAFMWTSTEIKKESIIFLSSFVKGNTFSDLNYRLVNRFPVIAAVFVFLLVLFSVSFIVMRSYRKSEREEIESRYRREFTDKTTFMLRAERRTSELVEKSGIGFLIWNGYGEDPVCDEGFTRITGYDCDDYSYETWKKALHPMDKNRLSETISALERGEVKEACLELRLKRKDGVWIWLKVSLFKTDSETSPESVTVLLSDITEFKKRESDLQEEKRQAEKEAQDKSIFLASMSHEIRTPVNGVIGISKILSETKLDEEQTQYVTMIRTAANNLMDIINDILDISKIEANMMKVKSVSFNLRTLIEKQMRLYAFKAHEKNLEMNLFVSPDIPGFLNGDPQMLQQVLINLISNAIKFTEKGEVNVMVNLLERNENAVNLKFVVEDTGIGISEEDMKMVFESFIQLDNHVQNTNKGTGLGLSISKKLVQLMGGRISLKSVPGKGTLFFFEVPFETGEEPNDDLRRSDGDFYGKKVLLIDNHITAVNFLSKMLTDLGANVYSIMKVEELPSVIGETDFDLILIDSDEIKDKKLDDVKALFGGNTLLMGRTCMMKKTNEFLDTSEEFCCASSERGLMKPIFISDIRGLLNKSDEGFRNIIVDSGSVNEDRPGAHSESSPAGEKIREGHEVLIVEDDPINLKVIEIVLKKHNLKTTSVTGGQRALEEYHSGKFDLIFMDINIPEIDGWEITRRIRENEKLTGDHITIIGLSSHVMEEDVKKAFDSGMDRYVTKPIDDEKIASILKDLTMS